MVFRVGGGKSGRENSFRLWGLPKLVVNFVAELPLMNTSPPVNKSRVFIVVAAALVLLSCSSNSKQEEARQGKDSRAGDSLFAVNKNRSDRSALAVPPDLLASSSEKVQANSAATTIQSDEVLPVVIGATIQSDARKSWLEIDADAKVVWQKLIEFWAFQDIELVEYQPGAGLMETDWFVKKTNAPGQGVGTIAVDLFKAFVARRTALDKFAIRLERNRSGGTNLFVTHRRREKIAKEYRNRQKATEYEWVEREEDTEKVAQLLQTIVLLFDSSAGEPA